MIKDVITGTTSIIGVLTRFHVPKFPGMTPAFFIFAQIGHGLAEQYMIEFEVQDDKNGTVVGKMEIPVKFSYRTEVRDVIIGAPPLKVNHEGPYTVAVLADGIEIARQSFDAASMEVGR